MHAGTVIITQTISKHLRYHRINLFFDKIYTKKKDHFSKKHSQETKFYSCNMCDYTSLVCSKLKVFETPVK